MLLLSAQTFSRLSDGKSPCELRFGEQFSGPIIPIWIDYLSGKKYYMQPVFLGEKSIKLAITVKARVAARKDRK